MKRKIYCCAFFFIFSLSSFADDTVFYVWTHYYLGVQKICRPLPQESTDSIMLRIWGLNRIKPPQIQGCSYWGSHGHSTSSGTRDYGDGAGTWGSATQVGRCKGCFNWGEFAAGRTTVKLNDDIFTDQVIERFNQGEKTFPSGAKTIPHVIKDEENKIVGIGYNFEPPSGVTPTESGYVEGYYTFDPLTGEPYWNYFPDYEPVIPPSDDRVFDLLSVWYNENRSTALNDMPTRQQFDAYISDSLAQGSSLDDAVRQIASYLVSTDNYQALLSLDSSLNAQKTALISELGKIDDTIKGKQINVVVETGDTEVIVETEPFDDSAVLGRLDSILSAVEDRKEVEDVPEGDFLEYTPDFEIADHHEDIQTEIDRRESWNTGIDGMIGRGLDLSFTTVFGSLPSVGENDVLFNVTFPAFFKNSEPINVNVKFSDYPSLSAFRSAMLFIMSILFCFSVYKIVSRGLLS